MLKVVFINTQDSFPLLSYGYSASYYKKYSIYSDWEIIAPFVEKQNKRFFSEFKINLRGDIFRYLKLFLKQSKKYLCLAVKLGFFKITNLFSKNNPTSSGNYCIKNGYICNQDTDRYTSDKALSSACQVDVYKFTAKTIKNNSLKNILDIGCDIGTKLDKFILPVCKDITGVDAQNSIDLCKSKYNFGTWQVEDLDNPKNDLNREFDLILSADVIEHLKDPDKLQAYIKKYSHKNTFIILSTPERDIVWGKRSFGPPGNKMHVREWNKKEFNNYIKDSGFVILEHFLVQELELPLSFKNIIVTMLGRRKRTQLVLCKVKNL